MEPTGIIGLIIGIILGVYMGIMEKKMETTVVICLLYPPPPSPPPPSPSPPPPSPSPSPSPPSPNANRSWSNQHRPCAKANMIAKKLRFARALRLWLVTCVCGLRPVELVEGIRPERRLLWKAMQGYAAAKIQPFKMIDKLPVIGQHVTQIFPSSVFFMIPRTPVSVLSRAIRSISK